MHTLDPGHNDERRLDVEALYRSLAPRLARAVELGVGDSGPLAEDACQFAWGQLVQHSGRVHPECVFSWLATTAMREALRLIRGDQRLLVLEENVQRRASAPLAPGPEAMFEQRQRLGVVRELPRRQQHLLWLHALGLSYQEIARHTGCSIRTVERQLLRARHSARELAAA